MSIETELLEIKGNKELLTAEDVVEWARSHPESAVHASLEWDDRKAAGEYRIWQARRLIAIHVTYDSGERKFVSLSQDRTREAGGYRNVDDVLRDRSLYQIMHDDALRELQRVQARYDAVKELEPVWNEVRKAKAKRSQEKPRLERRSAA